MPRVPVARKGSESHGASMFPAGQVPTKKIFNLTIPPVPKETYKAIANGVTKRQPWLGQKAKLDVAQQRVLNLRSQLKVMHEKLNDLERQKEKVVEDAVEAREVELKAAIEETEKALNGEFEEILNGKEQEWERERRSMKREMVDELKRLGTDVEKASSETQAKRIRLEHKSESEKSLAVDVNETSDSEENSHDDSDVEDGRDHFPSESTTGNEKNILSAAKSHELKVREIFRVFLSYFQHCI